MSDPDRTAGQSEGEMASALLAEDGRGLRIAYEHYVNHAPWVPFERFEMGVQILAESDDQEVSP